MGGNVLGYDMQLWATWAHMFFVTPPDPDVVGETWRDRWLERLESSSPVIEHVALATSVATSYWRTDPSARTSTRSTAPAAPGRRMGGRLPRRAPADASRRAPSRPGRSSVRGATGGRAGRAPGPHIDWFDREVRWWRRWLNGDENGTEHDARGRGVTCKTRAGPTSTSCIGRVAGSRCAHERARGRDDHLQRLDLAAGEGDVRVVTRHPSQGMHAPVWCPEGAADDFALDQRHEDAVSAVIEWEVEDDVALLGRAVARLRFSVEHPSCAGRRAPVRRRARRCVDPRRHGCRSSRCAPTEQEVTVSMRATGYVVPAGHRLRLAITPGYWPMLWPLPTIATIHDRTSTAVQARPALVATHGDDARSAMPRSRASRRATSAVAWAEQVFGTTRSLMARVTDSGIHAPRRRLDVARG